MIFHSAAMFNGIFVNFPVKKCDLDIFGWKAARACCQVGLEHGNEGASLVFSLWELPKAGVGMPMNGTWGIVRPRCSRNTDHYHHVKCHSCAPGAKVWSNMQKTQSSQFRAGRHFA